MSHSTLRFVPLVFLGLLAAPAPHGSLSAEPDKPGMSLPEIPNAPAPDSPLSLWYRRPAVRWLEALPLGNGRLGAMVYGGVRQERLGLNESTFWSGAPSDRHENPEGAEHLAEIRSLFFAGKYREGVDRTAPYLLGRTDNYGTHLPLGDLYLEMRHRRSGGPRLPPLARLGSGRGPGRVCDRRGEVRPGSPDVPPGRRRWRSA